MDEADRELAAAARDASPGAYGGRSSHEIEHVLTASSSSSSASSRHGGALGPGPGPQQRRRTRQYSAGSFAMSRISTQRDLELHPIETHRIQTHRSQHSHTVGRTPSRRPPTRQLVLPAFGAGKPFPPALPDQEEYVVEFDGAADPMHAQNWSSNRKILTAAMLGYTTMISAFGSSIFSAATPAVAREFGVSQTVGVLGVSLYVLGFAFGPSLWAPLSELKGRRLPLVLSMFGFCIFSLATARGKDIETVLISRFFSGFFGACPLAVVAAVFSDMFDNRTRGGAITIFSMAVFTGPLLGPFVGGFIVESHLGWRWTQYLVAILGFAAFLLDLTFLRETYPPVLLIEKADILRRHTKNWGIHAKQEEIEIDFGELISKNFSRPVRLLLFEPIVLLLSIYMAFIYGLLYLFLTAYPLVFMGVHGFSAGVAGLAFFGMIVGQLIAGTIVLLRQPAYQKKLAANDGVPIPEWRLPLVVAGGVSFAVGIFWFGWTGYRADVHWAAPTLSGVATGFGLMSIFLNALNYLVDAYLMFAASAIAGNTLLRSLFGAAFPLFATYMFNGLGINWAATLLGCVAVVLVPIPVVFLKYGAKLRQKSMFAPTSGPPPAQGPAAEGGAADAPGDDTEGSSPNGEKEEEARVDGPAAAAAAGAPKKETDGKPEGMA